MTASPAPKWLTSLNARLLGTAGVAALAAADALASELDADVLTLATYPGLPQAYAHDFAMRLWTIALRGRNRRRRFAPMYTVIGDKRAWLKGALETDALVQSGEAALSQFHPTLLSGWTDIDAILRELETVIGLAAGLAHGPRSAILTAWAHAWYRQWHRYRYWPVLRRPEYNYAREKYRKALRNLKLATPLMSLQEDPEAGRAVEALCLSLDAACHAEVEASEEVMRNPNAEGHREVMAFYSRYEAGKRCACDALMDWCELHNSVPLRPYF